MSVQRVLDLVAAAGLPTEALVVGEEPDKVPQAPSHRWVLVPMSDGRTTLGGMDRGSFATYGVYETDELAANALLHVAQRPEYQEPPAPVTELQARARELAVALQARPAGATYDVSDLPPGTLLDHIGFESGHVLFLAGTPFAERSSPPTDLQLPRTGYLLKAPLPTAATVAPVVPWFGQPGGGVMVSLDRPIRYYYDVGLLDRIDLRGPASSGAAGAGGA